MVNEIKRQIAYLGPGGTHSHRAALMMFGASSKSGFTYAPMNKLQDVFSVVRDGNAAFGVVPFVNNISGQVEVTFDMLLRDPTCFEGLSIVGDFRIHIPHDLLGSGSLNSIDVVYSKKEALNQCRRSLNKMFSRNLRLEDVESTAIAVQIAQEKGDHAAALAWGGICSFYPEKSSRKGMKILAKDVQDKEVNETRFLVIARYHSTTCGNGQHSWFVFRSSPSFPSLARVLSVANHWGIVPVSMYSVIIDPFKDELAYLLEIKGHRESFKITLFESDLFDVRISFIGSSFTHVESLKDWIEKEPASCMLDLFTRLPGDVRQRLNVIFSDGLSALKLYNHAPVSSVASVWAILGIPAENILKTLVLVDNSTGRFLYCVMLGHQSLDFSSIKEKFGKSFSFCPRTKLQEAGQIVGGISPLTCPENVPIVADNSITMMPHVFMGAGLIDMSVAFDPKKLNALHNLNWDKIAV